MSTPQDILARLAMPKRLEALKQAGLMDSEEEEDFNRVTRLARAMLESDICLVSFVDEKRQIFKSSDGLPEAARLSRDRPLTHSYCKYVVANEEALVIEDTRSDERVAGISTGDLRVGSYLGMPIFAPHGGALGSLCVIDGQPRRWSERDKVVLRDFSHLLENVIAVRVHARDALRAATSNAVLAREYNHRIKNSFAVSAGLVRASGRVAHSVSELVRDCTDRFAALGRAQDLIIGEHETTDLEAVVATALAPFAYGDRCRASGPAVTLDRTQVTPLALLLHELATNSAKYGALRDDAHVKVSWTVSEDEIALKWVETTLLADGDSLEGGFGSKVLEVAARQLAGRMSRRHVAGVMTVEAVFPLVKRVSPDALQPSAA